MKDRINWEVLSITRFFLAAIVMVGHLDEFTQIGYLKLYSCLGSFEAILGFLLISGFSIGKSIQRNNEKYFKRRIQRIYPVYLASIIFVLIVCGFEFNISSITFLVTNLFFLNHIVIGESLVGPAWTLALEVWLYSLAPVFLKLQKHILWIIIGISFLSFAGYTCARSLFHLNYYSGTKYGINLPLLAFMWVAGFSLAIFPQHKKNNSIIIALLFAGYCTINIGIQVIFRVKHHLLGELIHTDLPGFIGSIICVVSVYFLVLRGAYSKPFTHKTNQVLSFLGNISYPLYLTHYTTFTLLKRFQITNAALFILVALLISSAIYYMFDFYSKKRKVN